MTNGTAVMAWAVIFIPCQVVEARIWVGTGLIPLTEVALALAPEPAFTPDSDPEVEVVVLAPHPAAKTATTPRGARRLRNRLRLMIVRSPWETAGHGAAAPSAEALASGTQPAPSEISE